MTDRESNWPPKLFGMAKDTHMMPARTIEFTPNTIVIDGQPIPWPLSLDWGVDYRPHSFDRNTSTLSFAVLAETVTISAGQILIDGQPVPWLLANRGPSVTRHKSALHAVPLEILVDTSPDVETATGADVE